MGKNENNAASGQNGMLMLFKDSQQNVLKDQASADQNEIFQEVNSGSEEANVRDDMS